jgi:hypothetical protein
VAGAARMELRPNARERRAEEYIFVVVVVCIVFGNYGCEGVMCCLIKMMFMMRNKN